MAASQLNEKTAPTAASLFATNTDPTSRAISVSLDKDIAIGLVGEHAQEIDPETEARVLRKIDWFLIPAMVVGMRA